MRWVFWSPTNRFPNESIAIPVGALNPAFVPVPSNHVAVPDPAKVVTTPDGVTLRMRWLPLSTTYKFPVASKTILDGW